MAEIKDTNLIRDALGSPVPQYWDETSQMYIARTVDGSFADVDFSKVKLLRDSRGTAVPQLWDVETARFVPSKGSGNGEVTIGSVTGLQTKLDQTTATLAEKANDADVRKKAVPIGLNDASPEMLAAIEGGAGTSFNLLSIPQDESVTPSKTTFIRQDEQNLLDPNAVTPDSRIGSDGALVVDTIFNASDYIKVVSGKTYKFFANGTNASRIGGYDENKAFLKIVSAGGTTAGGLSIVADFTGYVRLSIPKTGMSGAQFVDAAIYNGSFTKFNLSLKDTISVSLNALPAESVGDRLLAKSSVGESNVKRNAIDLNFHSVNTPLIFPTKPKNLFDKSVVKNDFYIAQASGNETANTSYTASSFIRVEAGKNYTLAVRNQGAWYKADKTYLSGIPNVAGNTVLAPEGAYYMRMSTLKTNVATQMIVEGDVLGSYEEHYKETSKRILELLNSPSETRLETPEEIARTVLFSDTPQKIKLLGDSRTHGSGGTGYAQDGATIPGTTVQMNPNGYCWANSLRDLLAAKYGVTVVNYGQSGTNSLQIYQQMTTLVEDDDDLIIMMLGTNDRHNLASVEDTKNYQRSIINHAASKGIPVILMSAPPVISTETTGDNDPIRNFGMFDLDKGLQELAAEFKMKHISNYDNTIKFTEYRGVGLDTLSADGLHENDAGHDVIFRHVLRSMGITYRLPNVTK